MRSLRKRAASILAVVALSAATIGCSSGLGDLRPISGTAASQQTVETGDSIKVAIDQIDGTDGVYVINDAGTISLPYVDEVQVRGMTFPQIQSAIEEAFKTAGIFTNPQVNVQPAQLRPFYVLGEVNRPGEFEFRQGMTVQAAISAAGGYTYRAKTDEVEITRTVNGTDVVGTANDLTRISPGDRIRVLERWF